MVRTLQLFFSSLLLILNPFFIGYAQSLESFGFSFTNGLEIASIRFLDSESIALIQPVPLFSLVVDNDFVTSRETKLMLEDNVIRFTCGNGVDGTIRSLNNGEKGWKGIIKFQNHSSDTLVLENIVPFGFSTEHIYLTSEGPWSLARANIYLPERKPVSVILPDNAWELGYAAVELDDKYSVCAISRRTGSRNAKLQRYKTALPPRAEVEYTIYADIYQGKWQNGIKLMFHNRYLYDLNEFDNSLFEREDLQWIRNKYIITLQFVWDQEFYDSKTGKFAFHQYLEKGKKLFGGYDVFGIWPTWPRLGVDQRNQWELYSDLPFGLPKLKELSRYAKANGTRFFISYNPWDQSTDREDPFKAMATLIKEVDADGVVLDTRGSSSNRLQEVADSVRNGVIMYSEGMAVPMDMPGIVSGRVHNAINRSPLLNLNKLIKPEFAIFRVCVLNRGSIHRDIAISFFNGYGTEINMFDPGRPDWMETDFLFLGKTTKIPRENSSVFLNNNWIPLIPTLEDNIFVNQWNNGQKTLYTILSMKPEGVSRFLFKIEPADGFHFVSLWNHEELKPVLKDSLYYIPAKVREFNSSWLGTGREGNVDCIVRLPNLIQVDVKGDSLKIVTSEGESIRIWKGDPSYQKEPRVFQDNVVKVKLSDLFGRVEGKFVVQLFTGEEIFDEKVIRIEPGKPYLINYVTPTETHKRPPPGMREIPEGEFSFQVTNPDQFIPYPDYSEPKKIQVKRFFMDEYPVTNLHFYEFLVATQYQPEDRANFLKHWDAGKYPAGQENYPVVYVSLKDAKAYAEWANKRLPTEVEWQYAAQGTDGRLWPWGDEFHGTKCNNAFGRSTPVDAFSKGESPFKIADLVGNVWQLTNDVYYNGSYRFVIIRGGSYYKPTSSIWYVKGGPQPLNKTQMLLMVSEGFDRNSTVGFRCVADAEQ